MKELRDDLENEHKYTYWGGFALGYLKGKIFEIEEILDELNDGKNS